MIELTADTNEDSRDTTWKPTPDSTDLFSDTLLEDETVLITGGGTGIGEVLALAFADHGADVAVASRNMDHLEPVAESVREKGQNACAATVDVRDREKVDSMRDTVIDELGEVTILINNAGANFLSPAEELSENGWRSVVGTILDGTAYCSFSVGQHMIDNGGGTIISNGATNSEMGAPFHSHSGAGKAGVHNLMKSLAVEWGDHGIRCNTVAPGMIETEAIEEVTGGGFPEDLLDTIVADRFGEPKDCVPTFLYLASDCANYVTGGYFPVGGGHLLPSDPF
jgi:NAD(P)-dependent dehydrogenase (short-subunit alcohol dehydrogenase family)